jgi:hypothetical protein
MQMSGYKYRRVSPVHIVSIGLGDMLQLQRLHGLELTRKQPYDSWAMSIGHASRGICAFVACNCSPTLQHTLMLPRKSRMRQSRGRRHGINRLACAAKLLHVVLFRAKDNRASPPHACM